MRWRKLRIGEQFLIVQVHYEYRKSRMLNFISKIFYAIIFHIKLFLDKRPCTTLSLTLRMYFRVFNFCISQAV